MSPLVVIQYLRRRAAISAGTNSVATTRDATIRGRRRDTTGDLFGGGE